MCVAHNVSAAVRVTPPVYPQPNIVTQRHTSR
uniref:Uncharacterized protein n=1 Tax=Anguilla anguilla TaxID=7936 RepID=A0A0E9TEM2_ANGAN